MSNGDTSNMGGSRSDLPASEPDPRFPKRGKVLAELLARLEAQKKASSPSRVHTVRRTACSATPGTRERHSHLPPTPTLRRFFPTTAIIFTIACAFIVAAVVAAYLIRPEAALPAPNGLLQTRIQMKGLEMAVRMYLATYHRMPEGGVSNILAVLSAASRDSQNPDRIIFMRLRQPEYRFGRIVKPGDIDEHWNYLDGWGRPMQIEVYPETLSMRIRSFGPNGKDENGKGDDIEMLILANY